MSNPKIFEPEQLQAFAEDGFLLVRGLYSADEMAQISHWTDELANAPEKPGLAMMYFETSRENQTRILSRIENFVPFHSGFGQLITRRRMKQAVSELLGEPAVLFKDKINFKLPGGDGFKEHQDVQAGWDDYASIHVTAMVAIDETNAANGSLEVIAGLHRQGVLGDMWAPLSEKHTQGNTYQAIHCQPGDAIFFDSFVPHRSGPNLTSHARRVLYVTFNKLSEGDHRSRYYGDKRLSYPPDIEREPGKDYSFRV